MAPELPAVLGNGVGGVVTAVGDGADRAAIGRRVVTTTGGRGGYATRAVADRAALVDVPAGLDLADAVALLADGRTALMLFEAAAVEPGETVLVEAAAGGVGSLLVQLAAGAGARVVAAAGGPRKLELARTLVPDGRRRPPPYHQHEGGSPPTVRSRPGILPAPDPRLMAAGARPRATSTKTGHRRPSDHGRASGRTPRNFRRAALSERALQAAAADRIRPVVGQTFALDEAAAAHAAIEARATLGKTLLRT